jgi:diaphanous 1
MAAVVPVGPKLPTRRKFKPSVPMKKFHWTPIVDKKIAATLWMELKDDVMFDKRVFEAKFGQKAKKHRDKRADDGAAEKEKAAAKEVVKFVDKKRSYNCDIALARFKNLSNDRIYEAIMMLDDRTLPADKLSQIIKVAPTQDEIDMVCSFQGEVENLGKTEKFYRVIGAIPNLNDRLHAWMFTQTFHKEYFRVKEFIDTVQAALQQIKKSPKFYMLLKSTLAFGNYMNAGSKKACAGFKFKALTMLRNSKAGDGSGDLLQFLISMLSTAPYDKKYKRALEGELTFVKDAARVEFEYVKGEVGKLKGSLAKVKKLMDRTEAGKKGGNGSATPDALSVKMDGFYSSGSKMFAELETQFKENVDKYEDIRKWLGEAVDSTPWEEFFATMDQFVKMATQAEQQFAKGIEAEEKARKKKAYLEQRDARKATSKSKPGRAVATTKRVPGGKHDSSKGDFSGFGSAAIKKKKKKGMLHKGKTLVTKLFQTMRGVNTEQAKLIRDIQAGKISESELEKMMVPPDMTKLNAKLNTKRRKPKLNKGKRIRPKAAAPTPGPCRHRGCDCKVFVKHPFSDDKPQCNQCFHCH